MSKSSSRHAPSAKDEGEDNDECDESENYDASSSSSMSSSNDDECKESDDLDRSSWYSWSSSSQDEDDTCKVTLCHVPPPGTNCAPHMIRVGTAMVETHIEHGDYPGACTPPPPPPPPQCLPDGTACTVDADCCPGSICLPDPVLGAACGIPG